jgi:hypothetical protein
MLAAGTPVMRSTRSGQYEATARRACSKSRVRSAMNASSTSPSRKATNSMPFASAASVPGVSCK